jgi:subtilase family serine protease
VCRLRILAAVLGAAVLAGAMTGGAGARADAEPKPAETTLAGTAVAFASHARPAGDVPGSVRLTIQLWLKPDLAAAQRFAAAVSTPGSAAFRHYLSPAGYAARFGASVAATREAASWLRGQGFTGITADSGRNYVRATAPVSRINAAFRVRLLTYPASASAHAASGALHANNRAVSLPASLAGHVLAVTGLDNAQPVFPLVTPAGTARGSDARAETAGRTRRPKAPCSRYYGQHRAVGLPEHFGVTSFPTFVCGYSARQLRSAYGADWANTGKGQTVALVEQGLTRDMFTTLRDYAKASRMPAPSPRRYAQLSLGNDSCGDPFNIEEQLDVESSYDMAPGANQLVVAGDSCNQGDEGAQALYDADIMILDGTDGHPLATVASNSWGIGVQEEPLAQVSLVHAYLVRAAAEGVGMYFSAGDGSGNIEPSVDPDAISVGGTTLGIARSGRRLFETGWSTGISQLNGNTWHFLGEDGASGGGASRHWAQPAYQKGVVPRSLGRTRSAPDLAADADPFTGMDVGMLKFRGRRVRFFEESIGGTSEASPLVAGMVTAAQQGQPAPFGFINPAIYRLNGTSAFYDTLPLTASSPPLYRGVECDLLEFENICLGPGTRKNRVPSLTTFDDQSRRMRGYTGQVTRRGYDNMTGLGVPNGQIFIRDLRRLG